MSALERLLSAVEDVHHLCYVPVPLEPLQTLRMLADETDWGQETLPGEAPDLTGEALNALLNQIEAATDELEVLPEDEGDGSDFDPDLIPLDGWEDNRYVLANMTSLRIVLDLAKRVREVSQ